MSADADAPPPTPRAHVSSLDGLRGLAVASVMAVHAGVPGSNLGFLGVDLFFVLSGFLITSLLDREHRRAGRVDLGKFWGRRFLRLMPAYYLYVGGLTLAFAAFGWGWREPHGGWTPGGYIASLWFYYVNYAPQGGIWQHQWLTLHLWSLAVEEQFYLIWPLLAAVALPRRRAEALAWLLVGGVLVRRGLPEASLRTRLDTRGLGIILGCAVALSTGGGRHPRLAALLDRRWFRLGLPSLLAASLAGLSALAVRGRVDEAFVDRYAIPPLDVAFALLVASLWRGRSDGLARALSWRPLGWMGTVSYGIYLYHMLAHELTWRVLTPGLEAWPRYLKFPLRLALFTALTLAMAGASYTLVERPFLRLKERLR